jgi:hypothetical protein
MCRSLAACEQLYNAGFENLFWVQGGLEAAEEEVVLPSKEKTFWFLQKLLSCCFWAYMNSLFLLCQDFEREGPQPFKLAGIGGVSEFFG